MASKNKFHVLCPSGGVDTRASSISNEELLSFARHVVRQYKQPSRPGRKYGWVWGHRNKQRRGTGANGSEPHVPGIHVYSMRNVSEIHDRNYEAEFTILSRPLELNTHL